MLPKEKALALDTYTCSRCAATFRTQPEMDAHVRQHPPSGGDARASSGMKAGLRAQIRQLEEANIRLEEALLRSEQTVDRLKVENNRLLESMLRREEHQQRVEEQRRRALVEAQRQAADTVAAFSDEELTAMGITREQALERLADAIPPEVSTPIQAHYEDAEENDARLIAAVMGGPKPAGQGLPRSAWPLQQNILRSLVQATPGAQQRPEALKGQRVQFTAVDEAFQVTPEFVANLIERRRQ